MKKGSAAGPVFATQVQAGGRGSREVVCERDKQPDPSASRPANPTPPSKPVADGGGRSGEFLLSPPAISLPKGGGAIRGIGEKFSANPVTGTGSMSVPIATSPGRSGFGPQLSLSYDSGASQGPFGLGWSLSLPSITRKTDRGLPRYLDDVDSDTFILAGAEDLVPVLDAATGQRLGDDTVQVYGRQYRTRRYRPRIEGLFARIERWRAADDASEVFWRTISRDNVTSWFGRSAESRVLDPGSPAHVFQWMLCQTYDDKGNVAVYRYKPEDGAGDVWSSVRGSLYSWKRSLVRDKNPVMIAILSMSYSR